MPEALRDTLTKQVISAGEGIKKIRPPLKWAGGKYRILEQIRQLLPGGNRLIEPFVGSGVVFLNTHYRRYILNDINNDLITFYKILKKEGAGFIDYCRRYFEPENNAEQQYYAFREEFNTTRDKVKKSALFVYLNKHGYNGLCRYNASGKMNVPFGRHRKPHLPEKEMLHFVKRSQHAALKCEDFEAVMKTASPGDVIYCDPPYVPLNDTAYFTSYSAAGFNSEKQERLALAAREASRKGIPVLISNHATSFTKKLYSEAKTKTLPVKRQISCNGSKREHVMEILALYLPS
ncbi:MAG: Dam family site-specific DNA-(adenine-N6)-methyltransferase [Gammaproteobacteria bacterium]